jgi:hypothetical protein
MSIQVQYNHLKALREKPEAVGTNQTVKLGKSSLIEDY